MILTRFLPRDEQFFALFGEAAENSAECAQVLYDLFDKFDDVERKVRLIRDLEHRGDEFTHRIFNALNSTFVTPLDREDIRALASDLDDFVDYMEETTRRLGLYRIDHTTELARLLARIISEQAASIVRVMPLLENAKQNTEQIRREVVEINRLENEADDTLSEALAQVYDGVTDIPGMITALHWSELYQLLEEATDRAEHVANTIEGIMLKYA